MPQLDPSGFAPQLIWLAISFIALYLIMARIALPQVGQVLEERQARISESLEKAEAFRKDAEEVERQYEESMASTRNEAHALLRQVHDESAALAAEKQQVLMSELNQTIAKSEGEILSARDSALSNLRDMSAEVAQDIARQLAGVDVAEDQAKAAVDTALKERRP